MIKAKKSLSDYLTRLGADAEEDFIKWVSENTNQKTVREENVYGGFLTEFEQKDIEAELPISIINVEKAWRKCYLDADTFEKKIQLYQALSWRSLARSYNRDYKSVMMNHYYDYVKEWYLRRILEEIKDDKGKMAYLHVYTEFIDW